MGTLKEWAALAAVSAIVSAVIVLLLPAGKMKNAFYGLVGVILICSLISPFSSLKKDEVNIFENYSSFMEENSKSYQKKSVQTAVSVAEKGYESAIKQSLAQFKAEIFELDVECNDDCSLKKVDITLKGQIDEEEVRGAILKICKNVDIDINIKRVKGNE